MRTRKEPDGIMRARPAGSRPSSQIRSNAQTDGPDSESHRNVSSSTRHRQLQGKCTSQGRLQAMMSREAETLSIKTSRRKSERLDSTPGMVLVLCLFLVEVLVPGGCQTPCPDFTAHPPSLVARAGEWDTSQSRFADASGNGRHGLLTGGTVNTGTVGGNGAQIQVPFVGGSENTTIQWPMSSIPANFTICSITRYTGNDLHNRILACPGNWLHGHWNSQPGATYYEGQGNKPLYLMLFECSMIVP